MDAEERFKLVFDLLETARIEDGHTVETVPQDELDEIEELRRFSAELNRPQPTLFTTT